MAEEVCLLWLLWEPTVVIKGSLVLCSVLLVALSKCRRRDWHVRLESARIIVTSCEADDSKLYVA